MDDLRAALPWILIQNLINLRTYTRRLFSDTNQPDATLTLPNHTHLFSTRLFTPNPPIPPKPLPLLIRIHGGGFIMNNPTLDDPISRHLSTYANVHVSSLDYRKAPLHPFPAGLTDIITQIEAILASPTSLAPTIPVYDASNVFLSGASSGGNLALAACQDPRIRGRVRGVAATTPVAELATPFEVKMASRPDAEVRDVLGRNYEAVERLYLAQSGRVKRGEERVDVRDPRISPAFYRERRDLPELVFLSGAEHDLLCAEAREMAERLAGDEGGERVEVEGGWKVGGVRWQFFKGMKHAFEAFTLQDPVLEEERRLAAESMVYVLAKWIKESIKSDEQRD